VKGKGGGGNQKRGRGLETGRGMALKKGGGRKGTKKKLKAKGMG